MKSSSLPVLLAAVVGLSLATCASARDTAVEPMQGVPASRESQVTMANYRDYPMSMWSFRNAGAVLNMVVVPREGDIRPLPGPLRPELGERMVTVCWVRLTTEDIACIYGYLKASVEAVIKIREAVLFPHLYVVVQVFIL